MNQFDNAQFLQHPDIQKIEDLLQEYMKLQQDIIKDNYPKLIKTDNQWKQSLNETNNQWKQSLNESIFMPFKIKYLKCTQYDKYNDLILFACLNYDITRLNSILFNDNSYYIKKIFINSKCLGINSAAFMYMFFNVIKLSNQQFSNYYDTIFANYINIRVILPVYSILIPFYIFQYKNENLSKEEKQFIISILRNYIEDYKKRINSIENYKKRINSVGLFDNINIEYIEKMKPFAYLVQDFFVYKFINFPSENSLYLLLYSIIKKIDKSAFTIIINYIMKKTQCELTLLTLIKEYCILTDEQQDIINSLIMLKKI